MTPLLDIFQQQLCKTGEELCGDTIRIRRDTARTVVVLSDGLGSGVKANILSTMTAGILSTMLAADAPLDETVQTVIGTLPVCQVRKMAYATFTVVSIDNASGHFKAVNFDNPRIIWLKNRRVLKPERHFVEMLGRQVALFEGELQENDFLGVLSDGLLHAGIGTTMNLNWGWDQLAIYVEQTMRHFAGSSRAIVQQVMRKTTQLYAGRIGDDCSFVGVLARHKRQLTVFTGPPRNPLRDERTVSSFLRMPGRHVVCGGTTGNIVARVLDETPEVAMHTMRAEIPPIAKLREVDLMTEGILTLNKTMELLKATTQVSQLPQDENAAVLLARELLSADSILFLAGQAINDFYQNPDLPQNLSLRKTLVNDLARLLQDAGKDVTIEWC